MNHPNKTALKAAAIFTAAALLLSGCQENSVVENGDLPQSVEAQNDLTSTTTEATAPEETTTTTTTAATTTTTTTTTTTAAEAETEITEEVIVDQTQQADAVQTQAPAPATAALVNPADPPAYTSSDERAMYARNPVNVRSGPGTNYTILGVMSAGTKATIIGTSGDWVAVNYNNTTGYILTSLLSNSAPAANAAATTVVTTARQHVCGYRGGKNADGSYPAFKHDLEYMKKLSSDFIGWLTIKDTPIDLPVVQATDNKFYLEHDFYGRVDSTKVGVTFADWHVPVTENSCPQNLILYGHNIRTGVGLAKITNYYPNRYGSLDFYLKHPTFTYESIYGGQSTYVVFGGMFVNTDKKHGAVFNYYKFRDFGSKNTFYQYFEAFFDRSVFYNPAVNISYDDEFLTLSTCYYPMGIDTRFVLLARKLRKGESAKIDVSKAYTNPSPLYFDYYYQVNGGKWAGRKWPTSLIQGYKEWLDSRS